MSQRLRGFLQYAAIVVVSAVVAIGLAEAYLASQAVQPGALPFYGQLHPYVMFRPQSNLRYVSSETFVMSHHTEQVHHYTNEDGLRVSAPDYDLPRAKPPGQLRVAVLGGSAVEIATTFETTLPGSLKALLGEKYTGRDIEVINAGIQSSVSRQSLIHLMFTVADYQPDIVVLYDGHNDIGMPLMYDARPNFPYNFQVMQEAWDFYRARHEDSLWRVVLDRSHVYAALSARWGGQASTASAVAKGLHRAPHALTPTQIRGDREYVERFVAEYLSNWEKLIDLSKTYGFDPVFVLQPTGAFDREYTIAALQQGFNIEEQAAMDWNDAFIGIYRETGRQIEGLRARYPDVVFLDLGDYLLPAETYFWDGVHVYDEVNLKLAGRIHDEMKSVVERQLQQLGAASAQPRP